MDKVLVILAAFVFAASIIVMTRVKQRMEAKGRARRWQEREELFSHRRHRSTGRHSGSRVNGPRPAHGAIVALLAESLPDRIEVGGRTLLLRTGETCPYTVGTTLRVVYPVVEGKPLVDGVMAVRRPDS